MVKGGGMWAGLGNWAVGRARTRARVHVVRLCCFDEVKCSTLRRKVPLRGAEKFVTHHEFLNRGGAQERRKVVRMQVPLLVGSAVIRLLVESHRIGATRLQQIVVPTVTSPPHPPPPLPPSPP